MLRDTKESSYKAATGRKTFFRSSSQDLLTDQRKPRLQNSKTTASLHLNKGNKNSLPNTQRLSHRKNMSSHNISKFSSEIIDSCKVGK